MKTKGVVVLLLLVLAACAQQPTTEEPIRIGVIAPLTGVAANLGINSRVAAGLAADEINANGGINGRPIALVIEDGKCNGKEAAAAANKLLTIDGVPVIIGGVCSAETLAFSDVAERMGRVVLSPCSSSPDVTAAGDYIFRDYPSDVLQGAFGAEYLYQEGMRNVAILACLDDYCQGVSDVFAETFAELGGEILARESFEKGAGDVRTQITKIRNAGPEAVFYAGFGEDAIRFIRQKHELGWRDILIYGPEALSDPAIVAETGDAGEGVRFSEVNSPLTGEFRQSMQERLGDIDLTTCAPQAYDAVYIIAEVLQDGATTPEEIRDALYAMPPREGVSGTVEFDENGDLISASYVVKQYRNGKIAELSE